MDRTGIIAVLLCVVAYITLTLTFNKIWPEQPHKAHVAAVAPGASAPSSTNAAADTNTLSAIPPQPATISEAAPATKAVPEKLNFLENADIKVTFTTKGASIKEVALKTQQQNEHGDVVLNEQAHDNIMAITGWPGAESSNFQVESTPQAITYATELTDGVKWTRTYTIGKDYTLAVKDSLANAGSADVMLPPYSISVGRAQPLLVNGEYQPFSSQYVGAGWLSTQKFRLVTISYFNPGGWFSPHPGQDVLTSTPIDANPLRWLAVEDQFFAVLLTPPAGSLIPHATFRTFNKRDSEGKIPAADPPNIEAAADYPAINVPAKKTLDLEYKLFAGPKEHGRLDALGENQGELMNYGAFVIIIAPMLTVLHTIYGLFHNYGVAIIVLTLLIKLITWPLQSFANRSGKRMQAVAPKIKELQAKYKEQPEKLNSETFALYKDYGVNPFGGCLPALVQMPVFFSLYYMLQNAVELRGQSFLWVHDLTQPDTVFSHALPFSIFTISHLTINPLPILVTALMAVMMRMTPQIGDPNQAKVAQFMPLVFLFIFYNFAAGLSLYYVVNNSVSIFQIYRNLRKPLPELKKKVKKA